MKRLHCPRVLTCLLAFLIMCSLFTSCSEKQLEAAATTESTETIETTETVVSSYKAVIYADDASFEIEDAEGKTVQQLLKEANVRLNEGDVVTLDDKQVVSEGIAIHIHRMSMVSFEILGEDGQILEHYTIASTEDTVSDAIKILGIQIMENQELSIPEDSKLENGMNITVSQKKAEIPEASIPEATTPQETVGSNSGWDNNYYVPAETEHTSPPAPETEPTVPPTESTTAPTEPTIAPTEEEVTIVSVEDYPDPDGSGHGVKVITYSDGTQEEIAY